MSGSMNTAHPTATHIDYREAFVLDMELHAHSLSGCRQCIMAGLHGKPNEVCDLAKHKRETIKRAYDALPKYYKDRYTAALDSALQGERAAIESMGGR